MFTSQFSLLNILSEINEPKNNEVQELEAAAQWGSSLCTVNTKCYLCEKIKDNEMDKPRGTCGRGGQVPVWF